MKRFATLLLLASLSSATWAVETADIRIVDPYARAIAPGQHNSAVFMQLTNKGETPLYLTGASTKVAGAAELHTHTRVQGVMQMRRVDSIELPPHQTVALQPGDYHIMLIDLTRALNVGDNIDLKLRFSDGSEQAILVPVKPFVAAPKTANP